MSDYIKPDLTRRSNYPIFGDTVTFSKEVGTQKQIFIGVISEWNVGGPQVWSVEVGENKRKMHVHGCELLHIERTGVIPECPAPYHSYDPDLQNL